MLRRYFQQKNISCHNSALLYSKEEKSMSKLVKLKSSISQTKVLSKARKQSPNISVVASDSSVARLKSHILDKHCYIKSLLKSLNFELKDNAIDIFYKKYKKHNDYIISVDFKNEKINYGCSISFDSSTTQNFKYEENWVVLECVDRLLEKGYSPENITLEKTYPSGHGTSGRLDICVTRDDGTEYLLIECKTLGKELDKAFARLKKDGGQLFTYFKFSNKADVIMLYASGLKGNGIDYTNHIITIEDNYRYGDVKDFYDSWNKLIKDNGIFNSQTTPYNFKSTSLTRDMLKEINQSDSSFIFNSFLEILRRNTVSDKPNAFNKIFNLFLCKVYDEQQAKKDTELKFQWLEGYDSHIGFQLRLSDLYKKGMKEFLDKEVSDISLDEFENKYKTLDQSTKDLLRKDFSRLRLEKNNEFAIKEVYDHKSFEENVKILKEVVLLLERYQIRYSDKQQYLSDFFELLLTTGLKQESGQFFTPIPIAQFIIKSLPISSIIDDKLSNGEQKGLLPYIIDYAAGSGHFLTESMHEIQHILESQNTAKYNANTAHKIAAWEEDPYNWATRYIYGIEKDYRLVKVGKVGCYLHGDGLANVILSDGLANFSDTEEYKGALRKNDSIFIKENKQFDIVVSNPPYSVSSFRDSSREYFTEKDFDLYSELTEKSSEIECLFVERTKQLLKDGGVAGIILPSSILSNSGIYAKAREIILKYFQIIAITELGSNTFMATGTHTVVLFLRRKNNYESSNLQKSVDKFFSSLQDVSLNGIERPVEKYVKHAWEDISYNDYITLITKEPNEKIIDHEIFKEYQSKIKASNEQNIFAKIIEIEKEKIFYFITAYVQRLVLAKSGDKQAEKNFLGYEFSHRRGYEGIHAARRGKDISECTSLFDKDSYDNPEKLNSYIHSAFNGQLDKEIANSMKENVMYANLIDLMTFDRVEFDKSISLNPKKKIIESKWDIVRIKDIATQIITGKTPSTQNHKYWESKDINWLTIPDLQSNMLKIFSTHKFISKLAVKTSAIKLIPPKSVLISCTASIGYSGVNEIELTTNQQINSIICTNNISPYYLGYYLGFYGHNLKYLTANPGVAHVNISMLKSFKVPLPPLDIQKKIVGEIEQIEEEEKDIGKNIKKLKQNILKLMANVPNKNLTKLENLAMLLKRGKSAKYGMSNIQIIKSGQARGFKNFDFSEKYYVSENFIVDERKLKSGDILINSSGVGTAGRVTLFNLDGDFVVDSHITVLRPDQSQILPDFLLQSFVKIGFKTIEDMAKGQSGQIELNLETIKNIKIPLPSLSEQEKIVTDIELFESQISDLEEKAKYIPQQKEQILGKYL